MPMAATSPTDFTAAAPTSPGWFSRFVTALMRSRAAEAERIVADVMSRRGLRLTEDGQWRALPSQR